MKKKEAKEERDNSLDFLRDDGKDTFRKEDHDRGKEKEDEDKDDDPKSKEKEGEESEFELLLKKSEEVDPDKEEEEEEEEKDKTKKNDKETNIANLRKSRDDLAEKLKAYESGDTEFKKFASQLVGGDDLVTKESMDNFVAEYNSLKKKAEEYDTKLKEKDEQIKNISITHSEEWEQSFVNPHNETARSILAEVADFDGDEIKNEKLSETFVNELIQMAQKDGYVSDPVQIKKLVEKHKKDYREKTGESIASDININNLSSYLNKINKIRVEAKSALDNWETEKANSQEDIKLSESKKSEEENRRLFSERRKEAQEALNNFGNDDNYVGVLESSDIEKAFSETFKANEQSIKDPSNAPSYGDLLSLQAKGVMFDILSEKLRDAIDENEELRSKANPRARSQNDGGRDFSFQREARKKDDDSLADLRGV